MSRSAIIAAWFAVGLASSPHIQGLAAQTPDENSNVLVVDHDFSAAGEYVRVFLQEGQVYRAELSSPDLTLQIRGLVDGVIRPTQLPRVYPFLTSDTPSGTSVAEIYPEIDAEYEIRVIALSGQHLASRLRLYRDVRASSRRQEVRNTPGWEMGIELAGGWHSGYFQSSAPAPLGTSPPGGTDVEGCFSARGARGRSRVGLCVVGLSYQSQEGARSILWIYTEPRVRLLGRSQPGQSSWDLGASFRFGLGMISAASETPVTLAPGAYVARHIRRNANGGGWSFQLSYARPSYLGFGKPFGVIGNVHPSSNRVALGVAWYQ